MATSCHFMAARGRVEQQAPGTQEAVGTRFKWENPCNKRRTDPAVANCLFHLMQLQQSHQYDLRVRQEQVGCTVIAPGSGGS